ncbi:hypothetical protein MTBPR1_20342 [Candidatus Terasakiella magnetica]|uniref:Uncharacterized protein n=1 Tax=Candidatus Terasakiella magnetica TaxID=1867952 RepID=A0A1C3RH13_9PROT|nr:hypothetical protein MTBPR1_20342 [Candidatus Terasakiella magnetica]
MNWRKISDFRILPSAYLVLRPPMGVSSKEKADSEADLIPFPFIGRGDFLCVEIIVSHVL